MTAPITSPWAPTIARPVTRDQPSRPVVRSDDDLQVVHLALAQGAQQRDLVGRQRSASVCPVEIEARGEVCLDDGGVGRLAVELAADPVEHGQPAVRRRRPRFRRRRCPARPGRAPRGRRRRRGAGRRGAAVPGRDCGLVPHLASSPYVARRSEHNDGGRCRPEGPGAQISPVWTTPEGRRVHIRVTARRHFPGEADTSPGLLRRGSVGFAGTPAKPEAGARAQSTVLIIPAPTVTPVTSSIRMNEPVARFLE